MKKVLFLIGAIVSGYIGLVSFGWVINPTAQEKMPSGFLLVMGALSVVGLVSMRFFWTKFREPVSIQKKSDKMKILNMEDLLIKAGSMMGSRDMSIYNGKEFKCACGKTHQFNDNLDFRNFATTGVNAKMLVTCPYNSSVATLIQTKYKFWVIFDHFESLAGTLGES